MVKKIIVILRGGLGNQLFIYATARAIALRNDAELVLDTVSGFENDVLYKRTYALNDFNILARNASYLERKEPFGRIRRSMSRRLSRNRPITSKRFIQQVGVNFDPNLVNLRLQNGTTYFEGFGQSELYFEGFHDVIYNDLSMQGRKEFWDGKLINKIARNKSSVGIHYRWFDDSNGLSNMPLDYYTKAINKILLNVKSPTFYVFSDDTTRTKEKFTPLLKGYDSNFVENYSSPENTAHDFWLMRHCNHFIIGNSTFAWWAAWLGEYRDRARTIVIAPALSIDPSMSSTAWGFYGLLPERWVKL
jgi:hypothetical protein